MPQSPFFKNARKKSLCKHTADNYGQKPGTVRRVMNALVKAADKMAADHQAHFARFIHVWRLSAANVDAIADTLMQHPELVIPEEVLDVLLAPYSFESLFLYHHLAGMLNYAEEYEFVETSKALAVAWGKLCAVLQARPNVPEHDVELLQIAVSMLNPRVAEIYQGAAHCEPDREWAVAFDDARNVLRRIAKALAS